MSVYKNNTTMIKKNLIFISLLIALLGFVTAWTAWGQEQPAVPPVVIAEDGVVEVMGQRGGVGLAVYLPVIRRAPEVPTDEAIDMLPFFLSNGRLYEVHHSSGSQARHQTQGNQSRFYHTKGNEWSAEWEELWADDNYIMRGTDTSPGNGQYYTLFDTPGTTGSKWAPRHWTVGGIYERNPLVIFYNKSNCGLAFSGTHRTWLKFVAYHESYTFQSGLTLPDVVELAWLLSPGAAPTELYFYAKGYGLVGWGSNDRGFSYVSEIHQPGQRPDNSRETIACLNQQPWRTWDAAGISFDPLPLEYGLRVK